MLSKSKLAALGFALLAATGGAGALGTVACAGGAGIGLGIATLGVSAVFAGSSPGWALRDPRYATGATQPAAEDDIVLAPGETVNRCLFLGGELRSPVIVEFEATAAQAPATFVIGVHLARADDPAGVQGAPALTSTTVTLTTTNPTTVRESLTFSRGPGTISYAGDCALIRIAAAGGNTDDITIESSGAEVDARVRMTRRVDLTLVDESSSAGVDGRLSENVDNLSFFRELVLPGGQSTDAEYPLNVLDQATFFTGGGNSVPPTSITYDYEGRPRISFLVESPGPTEFDVALEDAAGGRIADAGPFDVDTTRRRVSADLQFVSGVNDFSASSTSGSATAKSFFLVITNQGALPITFVHDPSGTGVSTLSLPGPTVSATMPSTGGTAVRLSQPPPGAK